MKSGTSIKWAADKSAVFFSFVILICIILTGIVCRPDAVESERDVGEVYIAVNGSVDGAGSIPLTDAETALVCQLISAECRDEPFLARVAVAAVVCNRLRDNGFPDTVVDVIFSVGAFSSVGNGELGQDVSEGDMDLSRQALQLAEDGEDPTAGALYFARAGTAEAMSMDVYFQVGGMVFGR